MNNSDQNALPGSVENLAPGAMTLPVLEVLERLSRGESLDMILRSTGLDATKLQACFEVAASAWRKAHGGAEGARPACDPAAMSLSDALNALAAFGMRKSNGAG